MIHKRSAKGAARTDIPCKKPLAPHSVLREFSKSVKGAARTNIPMQETDRAALRFARVL